MPEIVTIGIPVRNGEAYIGSALASLASQTFSDFKVCISDNASTDRTIEICRAFCSNDSRFTLLGNPTNIGLFPNFARVLGLARTRYFMWLAHDDYLDPTYLALAIERLETDKSTVLFQTNVNVIAEDGTALKLEIANRDLESPDPVGRFRSWIAKPVFSLELFGVTRREALMRAGPMEGFIGSDRVLLSRLVLTGKFAYSDRYLFFNRDHTDRSCRGHPREVQRDASGRRRWMPPQALVYDGFVKAVCDAPLSLAQKRRCWIALGYWWFIHWNGVRLILDFPAYHFDFVARMRSYVRRRVIKWDPEVYPITLQQRIGKNK
jgi:glycosyltransferase involved in cell wall biosynthesis